SSTPASNHSAYPAGSKAREQADAGAVPGSEWKRGQAVYHDEYGRGSVIKVSMTESSGSLVIVQFETGKVAQFFPKYTKKLERIKD
ncbi:MAG: DNA/RNA helicase, partial [Spirochaetales bacterium]|nr:DNA/RNA helicase [Spirochaetales bacterium]